MYNEQIESLVKAALADGMLTEKEKQILFKKAESMGIDLDEFEMVLDARLVELQKAEKEKAEKSAPKSNKYGDVRKCPACGAIVPALAVSCAECGHEFTGVEANLSSKKLAELLLNEKSDNKKITIIETFPIPNTKNDLIEFLTSLKPRVVGSDSISEAYFKKYSECIEKAKVLFENDEKFIRFIKEFPELKRQRFINNISRKIKLIPEAIDDFIMYVEETYIQIILIILFILIMYWIFKPSKQERFDNTLSKIEKVVNKGESLDKLDALIAKAMRQSEDYDIKEETAKVTILTLIKKGYADEAIKLSIILHPWSEVPGMYAELMKLERFDDAWNFPDEDRGMYLDEPDRRYNHLKNCIDILCEKNKKEEAKKLLHKEIQWFVNNVDSKLTKEYKKNNPKSYEEKSAYKSSVVTEKLTKYIDEY